MMLKLQRLWLQITADRKRFGVLCGVLLLGLLLWSRLIVVSNLPRTAVAGDDESPELATSTTPTGKHPEAQKQARPDNASVAPVAVTLHRVPKHDPFQINSRVFPVIADFPQERPKSIPEPAENPMQIEARWVAQLQSMIDQLTLEAVLKQDVPLVVINAETYRQGDEVPAPKNQAIRFRLSEVRNRSVVLEYEGRMFELKMSSPPGLTEDQGTGRGHQD